MYNKKEEDFLEQRNLENLVETYREELFKVIDGHNCVDVIPTSVRRQMREDGILKKVGCKYTVSQLGRKMIEARDPLVKLC